MFFKRCNKQSDLEILLLTFNNISNTKKCINSLLNNTKNFKITILDNGSSDGTRQYLKDISMNSDNISLFLAPKNFGIVKGRNTLFDFSDTLSSLSRYICFLDNDQFVKEGWSESYLDLLSSGFDIVGAEGWKMRSDFYPDHKVLNSSDEFNYVGCGGMMMERGDRKKVGRFDEIFNPYYFEDPDYCFRAFEKNMKICWDPQCRVIHKPHKLLGDKHERLNAFRVSFKIFQDKWNGSPIPKLSNKL